MSRRIALIGHCGPDSSGLRALISRAAKDVQVVFAEDSAELGRVMSQGVDLLLFNRVLDYGFDSTDGVAVMRGLREQYLNAKMMLISNFSDAQAQAVAAGALPGFGKREMGSPRAVELIRSALGGNSQ
jgi:DNA-binding NarL/FixJ family response regulator